MSNFDVLMFDLDGTLVDSRRDICDCTNFMLRKLGMPERDDDLIISYVGNGAGELITQILGDEYQHLHTRAVSIFRSYLAKDEDFKTVLYEGVIEVLDYFNDKQMFVVTNRPLESAVSTLKRVGIADRFVEVYGGTKDLTKLKPDTWMVDQVVKQCAHGRSSCLMIGDTNVDIQVAVNAGIKSCGAAYGFFDTEYLNACGPDYIIDNICELKKIVL